MEIPQSICYLEDSRPKLRKFMWPMVTIYLSAAMSPPIQAAAYGL